MARTKQSKRQQQSSTPRLTYFKIVASVNDQQYTTLEIHEGHVEVGNPVVKVFLEAVKKNYARTTLKLLTPCSLCVYKNRASFDRQEQPLTAQSCLTEPNLGESMKDALIVVVPLTTMKLRVMQYISMSVEGSDRKFLDALALQLSTLYTFGWRFQTPTIGDVLSAKKKGTWSLCAMERHIGFNIGLPNIFNRRDWREIIRLNQNVNQQIHDGTMPLSNVTHGNPFIILRREDFTTRRVTLLKNIGVKCFLFPNADTLQVEIAEDLAEEFALDP
jgi:hypothetical protein